MTVTIVLPWPPPGSSQNGRKHWREQREMSQTARAVGRAAVNAALGRQSSPFTREDELRLAVRFCPPTRAKRDLYDNMPASTKSFVDGVFEALECDDSQVVEVATKWGDVVKGGEVLMVIEKVTQ